MKKIANFWIKKLGNYADVKNSILLEIGCGDGKLGLILERYVVKKYYGIDPDPELIAKAKRLFPYDVLNLSIGRAEKIPFKRKFDILIYTFSWHFIKDFNKALSEARRVLKKNGIIAILEPNKKTTNWKSPVLRKNSPEFSATKYKAKLRDLERARDVIYAQKIFKIEEENIGDEKRPSFWILRHIG